MTRPCAYNLTRREIHYRHEAFSSGLQEAGFDVRGAPPASVKRGDCLLIWNRYMQWHDLASRFEAGGGTVVVAENGYVGPGGVSPVHMEPRSVYALARSYHNDAEVVPEGSGERWDALGVDLRPWRASGGHVLVCPNRSFGTPGRFMPSDWGEAVCRRLAKLTRREVRLRLHPGNNKPRKDLAEDLAGAWAVVIWSSSAGVHALVAGIPVICEAGHWICKGAAGKLDQVEAPPMPERRPAFEQLARAQFSLQEIANGHAFSVVMNRDDVKNKTEAA